MHVKGLVSAGIGFSGKLSLVGMGANTDISCPVVFALGSSNGVNNRRGAVMVGVSTCNVPVVEEDSESAELHKLGQDSKERLVAELESSHRDAERFN